MPAKAEEKREPRPLVVSTTFAYARTRAGEVRQLRRGDLVDQGKFDPDSVAHLLSIGFLSEQ